LDRDELRRVAQVADRIDVGEGKELLHEGSFAYEFMVIENGSAEVIRDGKHVAELGPGDFLGEIAALEQGRRNASVIARSPMSLVVMTARDLRQLADAIAETKRRTDRPFGVNLRSDAPDVMERAELMVKEGVRVASFALAPSEKLMKGLKDQGLVCIPSIGAKRHAEKVASWGADAVIVQGGEAGGHTGSVPTTVLLPQVVDAVDIPVIAAGGFFDGRGLVAALAYGAVGIAMGTRFLLTSDSPVPAAIKQIYLAKGVTDTIVTTQVDGHPHRVLRTPFVDRLVETNAVTSLPRAIANAFRFQRMLGTPWLQLFREALSMKRSQELSWSQVVMAANAPMLLRASMIEGNTASGVMAGGQVTGLIEDLPSCAELIDRIMSEADAILHRFASGESA
jgi:NAD(P)H-dependent flavin oxidoreductase YrpB (nitropropane dioxygenase family)